MCLVFNKEYQEKVVNFLFICKIYLNPKKLHAEI